LNILWVKGGIEPILADKLQNLDTIFLKQQKKALEEL
tara:strand:+ start:869 stop:979 length:111 start_codon:yes stop_codon:yes gene_type:complete